MTALCGRCRADVVQLTAADGTAVTLDAAPRRIDDVPVAERFLLLAATCIDVDVKFCLRRHVCAATPPLLSPGVSRVDRGTPLARADHHALRHLANLIELYRMQQTGRLRPHPAQRHYDEIEIGPDMARVGHLDPNRCVLCRGSLAGREILEVGRFVGDGRRAYVHVPDCRAPEVSALA